MYDDEEASSASGSEGHRYQTTQEDMISEPDYNPGANFLVLGKEQSSGSNRYLDEDQIKVLDKDL